MANNGTNNDKNNINIKSAAADARREYLELLARQQREAEARCASTPPKGGANAAEAAFERALARVEGSEGAKRALRTLKVEGLQKCSPSTLRAAEAALKDALNGVIRPALESAGPGSVTAASWRQSLTDAEAAMAAIRAGLALKRAKAEAAMAATPTLEGALMRARQNRGGRGGGKRK